MPDYPNKSKRNGEDMETEHVFFSGSETLKELYSNLYQKGFDLKPDIKGKYSAHEVYRVKPVPFKPEVKVWKRITKDDTKAFNHAVENFISARMNGAEDQEKKVLMGLYNSLTTNMTSKSHNYLYSQGFANHGEDLRTRSCTGQLSQSQVPSVSWFPKLEQLDPMELLALMPKAEASLLMLVLGRLLWGNDNVKLTEGVLKHYMRTAVTLVGLQGGLGKSTLMAYINGALGDLGYHVKQMPDVGTKFGWGEVAESDLAFKDDMNSGTQQKLMENETVKTIITGGDFSAERKGENATDVKATAVIICCSNNYNKGQFLNLDDGAFTRYRFLYTYNQKELTKNYPDFDAKTVPNWKRLAAKYDVSISELAGYLLARSAEMFLDASAYELKNEQLLEKGECGLQELTDTLTKQLVLQTDLKHLQKLVTSVSHLVALSLAHQNLKGDKLDEAIKNAMTASFGAELMSCSLSAYVAHGKKDKAAYLPDLSMSCYNPIKHRVESWSNVGYKKSALMSFESQVAELISADDYKFPKSPAFYNASWTEAVKDIPDLVQEYLTKDMEFSDEMYDTLKEVYKIVR